MELGRPLWNELLEDEVFDRAASLSYYFFLFAVFPTLLFLTALLGLLPIPHLMDQFMGYLARVLPGDAASLLRETLPEIVLGANGRLLSLGVLAALWAASNGMASVITALNVAYDVAEPRPWWKRRLIAVGLTLGFSVFTLVALLLLVFGERIGQALAGWVGLGPMFSFAWAILRWPAVIFSVLTGITLVYYLAPAAKHRWQWVTPGSAFALLGWLLMSFALRLYVTRFGDYNATYGSIGGVILLLLWLYFTGVALLVGAEIDSEIEHASREAAGKSSP